MIRTLATTVALLTAALAIPASAVAETDDERFLALLPVRGLQVFASDEDRALLNARANCVDLQTGIPREAILHTLTDFSPQVTAANAESFLALSVEVFCPGTSPAALVEQAPAPTSAYYPNCAAARAAGAAPIYVGEPGYSSKLDRDGDGVACE